MAGIDRCLAVFLAFAATAALAAGDAPGLVPDAFDPTRGRALAAGEWVEYLIAFPVDPLENSLSPNPAPSRFPRADQGDQEGAGGDSPPQPTFDPPEAWAALPLRLEVIRVEDEGLQVRLSFEGMSRSVFLPMRGSDRGVPFCYESPQPEDAAGVHRVGDRQFQVTVIRRQDPRGGFIRLASRELPFALARFATESVDISFVAMGEGAPPSFPLPESELVSPPPGLLYKSE